MNAEELKSKLRKIFGNQIIFNTKFEMYADNIKNVDDIFISWCLQVKEKKILPIPSKKFMENLIFIRKIGNSNRCIIIKIKNGIFSEIHLGDHQYYDELRVKLGIKESSVK